MRLQRPSVSSSGTTARWTPTAPAGPTPSASVRSAIPAATEPRQIDAIIDAELRASVWEFIRPMLSPALVALNREAFIVEDIYATTVDLEAHRATSSLDELDITEPDSEAA